jgi:lipopolysaccharide exporter
MPSARRLESGVRVTQPQVGLPEVEGRPREGGDRATDGTNLVQKVRRGAMWTAGSSLLLRIGNILIMAVVARLVAPEELGVFALAMTVQAVLVSMAELGVASAIARSDLDIDKIAPTIATISVGTSILLAALMGIFAEPIALALGSQNAVDPIRIMAITVALIGPFAVPGAQLQRDFRQDVLFRASLISFVAANVALVALAMAGDGAIAFAWSRVIGQIVVGLIMVLSVRKRYPLGWNSRYVSPLLRFGLPLATANLLSQILLNVDYAFIGRLMETADVGIYMLAFNVSTWSTALIGSVLNGLVLPAFSRIRGEGGDVKDALSRAVQAVALVACPIAAFTATFSTDVVVFVYGPQWSASGPVLAVLSFYGVIFVIGLLFANIIVSTGKTGALFVVQLVALVFLVPALTFGAQLSGLIGIGLAHIAVISLVTLPVYLVAIRKTTGAGLLLVLRSLGRPAAAAAAAAAAGLLATAPLDHEFVRLLVGAISGALVYVLMTAPQLRAVLPERIAAKLPSLRPKRRGRHSSAGQCQHGRGE